VILCLLKYEVKTICSEDEQIRTMNNSISSGTVSLPLVRGWTKSDRIISKDARPTKFLSKATSLPLSSEENLYSSSCLVCKENEARYVCPRCQTPYCSMKCYRDHATRAISSTSSTDHSSFSCTEEFFKEKVTSLMQLESLEQVNRTHQALNRYHHNKSQHQEFSWATNTNDDKAKDKNGSLLPIEYEERDLYQLLSKLEELDDGNQLSPVELSKLLPVSIKAMFENDLQHGQIQELVLDRWYPWWKRELVHLDEKDENKEEKDEINDRGNIEHEKSVCESRKSQNIFSKTLDERLFGVPDFDDFGKNKDVMMSNNNDILLYNLLDILHATCRILRLYHGVKNASRQAPVEAAITLIKTSSVLSKDTRFITLSQVLTHCTTESLGCNNEQTQSNNKLSFIEDIALLLTSHRLVGRALLEAADILKAATKELKSNQIMEKYDDNGGNLKQIRRLRKKLQFFLSWTQHPATVEFFLGGSTKDEILAWMVERKTMISEYHEDNNGNYDDDNGNDNNDNNNTINTESFKVPSSTNIHHQRKISSKTQRPLMVEVESRLI